ncbi:MAG: homocysteine S-methyltransferase family protein [Candidatus Aminicenantales bacterium]
MNKQAFLTRLTEGVLLFDGAMGTQLLRRGLARGECPETWNLTHSDAVEEIHKSYWHAGSDVVTTNSFGGHPIKLRAHGLAAEAKKLNLAAARLASRLKKDGQFVAGSMGPAGKFLKPYGPLEESELEAGFRLQAAALFEGGVDVLLIETMYDLREALCALKAARAVAPSLPVLVTMTFQRTGRGFFTLMGDKPEACLKSLEDNSADGVGANCTLTSQDMAYLVPILRAATSLPLLIQPNAGQPKISPAGELIYSQTVEEFVAPFEKILKAGVQAIGGCCGTTPQHIERLKSLVARG